MAVAERRHKHLPLLEAAVTRRVRHSVCQCQSNLRSTPVYTGAALGLPKRRWPSIAPVTGPSAPSEARDGQATSVARRTQR